MSNIYARIELGPLGEFRGQIFAAEQPHVIRTLEILLDDHVCAQAICDLPGVNGGKNGFEITLPLAQMRFSATSRFSFRDKATGTALDRPVAVPDAWRARQLADPSITGYVESVSDDGRVVGWVWAPAAPRERLLITVMVDDQPALQSIAAFDRADLRDAGIGDGKYGFDCTLPWEAIANQRQIRVSVRATPMLVPIGKSFLLRRDQSGKLEERLATAEAELKRVKAELVAHQLQLRNSGVAASAQLFETVGAFFTQLAKGAAAGEIPVLAAKTGTSLADLAARFPQLRLAAPGAELGAELGAAPEARIVIPAMGSIDAVAGVLEALARTGADRRCEVLLYDDGSVEEAALLPALVRNLRYLRLLPGEEAGRLRNEALLSGAAPRVILLSPCAHVEGAWLDLLEDALEPGVAAAGAGLVREDGLFHSTGLLLGGGVGRLIDIGAGLPTTAPSARVRRDCDALGFGCVALTRDALQKQGGFDPGIADWCGALLNYCLALRAENLRVRVEPSARVNWLELPDQPLWVRRNLSAPAAPMPQLRLRWKKLIQAADGEKRGLDRGYRGHVLVVGEHPALEQLLQEGYRVSLLAPAAYDDELRRQGVEFTHDAAATQAKLLWVADPAQAGALLEKLPGAKVWSGEGQP